MTNEPCGCSLEQRLERLERRFDTERLNLANFQLKYATAEVERLRAQLAGLQRIHYSQFGLRSVPPLSSEAHNQEENNVATYPK
jgi:hypothetical protein